MAQIYVSEKEHDLLVNLISDALLTKGALDSDGFNAAFSLLKKIGYPPAYISELWDRTDAENYRYSFPQCNNDEMLRAARLEERTNILAKFDELVSTESKRFSQESVPVVYAYRIAQVVDSIRSEP